MQRIKFSLLNFGPAIRFYSGTKANAQTLTGVTAAVGAGISAVE